MKRIFVCGSNGFLGQRLARKLALGTTFEVLHSSNHRSFVLNPQLFDFTQLDITVKRDVKSLIGSFRPDIIVNCSAMSNVDRCENERELAWKINVIGVENLVSIARRIGSKIIHVSSDYVFDGKKAPYAETNRVNPVNYYGKTKLAGEYAVCNGGVDFIIMRTVLLYGSGVKTKSNFVSWVIDNLRSGKKIRCAEDQVTTPTFIDDLAEAIISSLETVHKGIYHVAGSESLSRMDIASIAANIFGLDGSLITAVTSADLQQGACRPLCTSFDITKAVRDFRYSPVPFQEGLLLMRQEMEHQLRN